MTFFSEDVFSKCPTGYFVYLLEIAHRLPHQANMSYDEGKGAGLYRSLNELSVLFKC